MQSLMRAFGILEELDCQGKSLSLGDIASSLKLNKSTVRRFLVTLSDLGYVDQDSQTKFYRLTPKLARLGESAGNDRSLVALARPYLDMLSRETVETINLGILDDIEVYYLDKRDSPHPFRMCVEVGGRAPVHATALGKSLLAFLPEKEARSILSRSYPFKKYTNNTLTLWSDLEKELAKIREQGVAYDNEELFTGLKCMSAPIFQHGNAVAAISISSPATRVDELRLTFFKDLLIEATHELSNKLESYWR